MNTLDQLSLPGSIHGTTNRIDLSDSIAVYWTRRNLTIELPDIETLSERHFGVSDGNAACFYEAAQVALSRHHTSPTTMQLRQDDVERGGRIIRWKLPNERICASHANNDDATANAAYAIAIAAVELDYGLRVIGRTQRRSGADWYLSSSSDETQIEDKLRLEVSGIDEGGETEIRSRVRRKLAQVANGDITGPAIVAIIAFKAARIDLKSTDDA